VRQLRFTMNDRKRNAQLALMNALGALQESSGLDTRITAPADAVAGSTGNSPYVIGVWKSWEGLNNDDQGVPIKPDYDIKYDASKDDYRFLRWLVSSAEDEGVNKAPSIAEVTGHSDPYGNTIPFVTANTLGTASRVEQQVHVRPTKIWDDQNKAVGSYAWWVQGNNSKALMRYDEFEPDSADEWSQKIASNAAAYTGEFGIDNVEDLLKVASHDSLELVNGGGSTASYQPQYFHDLTSFSRGLLTNVSTGGWKRDLSLFSEKWEDYDLLDKRSHWGTPVPATGLDVFNIKPGDSHETALRSAQGGYLYPWVDSGSACMSWSSLADYASLHKKMELTKGAPVYKVSTYPAGTQTQDLDRYNIVEPILARVNFTLGYSAQIAASGAYEPLIATKPSLVYFNPYNTMLDSSTFSRENMFIQKSDWPVQLSFNLAGQEFKTKDFGVLLGARNNHPVRVSAWFQHHKSTGAEQGSIAFTWQPGESKVMGVADREGVVLNKFANYQTRMHTGYNKEAAYKVKLYQSHIVEDGKFVNGKVFDSNTAIGATLDYSDELLTASDPVVKSFSIGNRPGLHPSKKEISMVLDPDTIQKTLPIPEMINPERASLSSNTLGSLVNDFSPFLSISFGLRDLYDGTVRTKGYINNKLVLPLYFESTVHQNSYDGVGQSSFDWKVFALSDINDPNLTNIDETTAGQDTSGYIGTSHRADMGVNYFPIIELPTQPLMSLAQLRHFDPAFLNYDFPLVSNALSNSHASPFMEPDEIFVAHTQGVDHSYVFNHLMWDDWFVSSLAAETSQYLATGKTLDDVFSEFLQGEGLLLNRSYMPAEVLSSEELAQQRVEDYKEDGLSWQEVGSEIVVNGMFNINSTSVAAWTALLKSRKDTMVVDQQILDEPSDALVPFRVELSAESVTTSTTPMSRMTLDGVPTPSKNAAGFALNPQEWSDDQVEALAEAIVEQIKMRGPFLSLSEFMNRQLQSGSKKDLALAGVVEAALMSLEGGTHDPNQLITDEFPAASYSADVIPSIHPFEEAAEGHVAYGLPGWARQGDVLSAIAPVLSARDDTFTIRAYGDARDKDGAVMSKAWCEAVVVRTAEYVDSANEKTDEYASLSEVNRKLGRKYRIISFRWLDPSEI